MAHLPSSAWRQSWLWPSERDNTGKLFWASLPTNAMVAFPRTITICCSFIPVAPQIYIFHIYTRPKFTQIPNLHRTQIYTNPDLHGTHIYTAQIYTNPFSHIDSKKPKFTQPKFTQNFFFKFCIKLYQMNSIMNPG